MVCEKIQIDDLAKYLPKELQDKLNVKMLKDLENGQVEDMDEKGGEMNFEEEMKEYEKKDKQ